MSPINNKIETSIDTKILKFIKIKSKVVKRKDIEVPDHVLLGLIFGIIRGPRKDLPNINAIVSFRNEIKNNR